MFNIWGLVTVPVVWWTGSLALSLAVCSSGTGEVNKRDMSILLCLAAWCCMQLPTFLRLVWLPFPEVVWSSSFWASLPSAAGHRIVLLTVKAVQMLELSISVQRTKSVVHFENLVVFELMFAWVVSCQLRFFSNHKIWLYYVHIIAPQTTGFCIVNISHIFVTNSALQTFHSYFWNRPVSLTSHPHTKNKIVQYLCV